MFESLGILMLTALMAATEPAITPSELQKNCEKLAAEKFNRETANDEDRFDYGGHYNARPKKRFYRETYISHTPVGTDLQDNRIYGGYHRSTNIGLFYCDLQDKQCHSTSEWNAPSWWRQPPVLWHQPRMTPMEDV